MQRIINDIQDLPVLENITDDEIDNIIAIMNRSDSMDAFINQLVENNFRKVRINEVKNLINAIDALANELIKVCQMAAESWCSDPIDPTNIPPGSDDMMPLLENMLSALENVHKEVLLTNINLISKFHATGIVAAATLALYSASTKYGDPIDLNAPQTENEIKKNEKINRVARNALALLQQRAANIETAVIEMANECHRYKTKLLEEIVENLFPKHDLFSFTVFHHNRDKYIKPEAQIKFIEDKITSNKELESTSLADAVKRYKIADQLHKTLLQSHKPSSIKIQEFTYIYYNNHHLLLNDANRFTNRFIKKITDFIETISFGMIRFEKNKDEEFSHVAKTIFRNAQNTPNVVEPPIHPHNSPGQKK